MRLFFDSSCDKRYGKNGKSILSIIGFHKDVFFNPLMAKVSLLDPWSGVEWSCSHPEVFCKKTILKNFAKFIEKHLCQFLF